MGTLGEKFSYLIATKNLIKTILRNKGQSVSDNDTFRSYADKINNLVPPPSGTINIGQNGAHDVSNYANANVSVQPTLQTKNVSPSTNQQSITPDQNYDGLSEVTVGAIQTETKTVKSTTSSQTVTPTSGKFIDEITVDPIDLESKTVTPTTSQQTITPSSGKDGLDSVTIGAVDNTIDNNIVSGNIKSGITILGVSGSSSVVETSDANAVSADMVKGKTAYVNGSKVTGDATTYEYPIKSGDYNYSFLPSTLGAYTYTKNGTSYLVGQEWVAQPADPDCFIVQNNRKMKIGIPFNEVTYALSINAAKIKKGATIAGVAGTYTSDATATAGNIAKGKTAYVNGNKITGTYDISAEKLMASYMAINALPFNHNVYQIFNDMAQDGTADYSLHTITYSPTDVYMYLDYIKTYEWIYMMAFPYAPEIIGPLQSLYISSVSSYYLYHDASYYNFDGTTSIEITQGIYKVIFTVIISNDRISNVSLSVYNTSTNTTVYSVSANVDFTPGSGDMPTTIQGGGDAVSKAIYMMLKNTPISNIKITSSALNSSSDIELICNNCAHLIDDYIKLITETE